MIGNSVKGASSRSNMSGSSRDGAGTGTGTGRLPIWVLLLVIAVLTIIISLFPEQRKMIYDTEQQIEKVVFETEQQMEQEMIHWWSSKEYDSTAESNNNNNDHNKRFGARNEPLTDADIRMRQQSSKWVDSEKKLKVALQVLVDRQAQGKDLGVPVLTRYLGDEVPVFYSADDASLNKGINTVEEWNTIIQQKYDEMRRDENQWREMISNTILSSSDRG
jgi:hypothetical protein